MTSDLVSLSWRKLSDIQLLMSAKQSLRVFRLVLSLGLINKLCVVGIEMKLNILPVYDVTQRQHVKGEKDGT